VFPTRIRGVANGVVWFIGFFVGAIETGKRIGRDPGLPPLDHHISVIIVMRRLDQLDDKPAAPQYTTLGTIPRGNHTARPDDHPNEQGYTISDERSLTDSEIRWPAGARCCVAVTVDRLTL
jgi:hypothetical protein